jgi:hypothetical protein
MVIPRFVLYAVLAMIPERPPRVRLGLLAILAVLLALVGGAAAQPAVQSPLLLMISIDGLRPDQWSPPTRSV